MIKASGDLRDSQGHLPFSVFFFLQPQTFCLLVVQDKMTNWFCPCGTYLAVDRDGYSNKQVVVSTITIKIFKIFCVHSRIITSGVTVAAPTDKGTH